MGEQAQGPAWGPPELLPLPEGRGGGWVGGGVCLQRIAYKASVGLRLGLSRPSKRDHFIHNIATGTFGTFSGSGDSPV